ncbi:hypothetical protein BUE93_11250 [Chromobacterium amazonense]|uniref:Uncharacterized protein n=1 Tax=Chromobacterium amazonense TaxID=1382803 RepID=A0A2S9X536_9NEIS|nr:phage tail fiber protein [Chromobacterium amazonense]PRP70841.1 hypothetical protein BUE93_11250 [Chromobacterium amazonense]
MPIPNMSVAPNINDTKSFQTWESDGSTVVYSFAIDYLRKSFMHVEVDGKRLTPGTKPGENDWWFSKDTEFTLAKPVPQGDLITIKRLTPSDRIIEFIDGSILKSVDLNVSALQTLHISEEARDYMTNTVGVDEEGNIDFRFKRGVRVGDPTEPQDALNLKTYQEDAQGAYQSRLGAEAARDAARQAQDAAKASQDAAKTSETNAAASEVQASKFRDYARKWAEQVDTPVADGNYGAKKYALDAAASQAAAKASQDAAAGSQAAAKASQDAAAASQAAAKHSEDIAASHAGQSEGFPVGCILPFAYMPSSPDIPGWLLCNGARVSQADYPALFAKIGFKHGADNGDGTFALPFYEHFLRGTVDESKRAVGSYQEMAVQSHSHGASIQVDGAHNHAATIAEAGSHQHGVNLSRDGGNQNPAASPIAAGWGAQGYNPSCMDGAGNHSHGIDIGRDGLHGHVATIEATGEEETRPKNHAVAYYIKAIPAVLNPEMIDITEALRRASASEESANKASAAAVEAKTASEGAAQRAGSSEAAALEASAKAKNSEQASNNSAVNSEQSYQAAKASEDRAFANADRAGASAKAAADSAAAAHADHEGTQNDLTLTNAARDAAKASQDAAAASATAAKTSETNAEKWANEVAGQNVEESIKRHNADVGSHPDKLSVNGGLISGTISNGAEKAPAIAQAGNVGNGWDNWQTDAVPVMQIECPSNTSAYMAIRWTKSGERHLAAIHGYAGGAADSPPVLRLTSGNYNWNFQGNGDMFSNSGTTWTGNGNISSQFWGGGSLAEHIELKKTVVGIGPSAPPTRPDGRPWQEGDIFFTT